MNRAKRLSSPLAEPMYCVPLSLHTRRLAAKVARVPEYWIPLMVGVGLILFGLLRRFIRRNS